MSDDLSVMIADGKRRGALAAHGAPCPRGPV